MKKIITGVLLAVTLVGAAQAQRVWHPGYRGGSGWWILPSVIAGAVIYDVTRPAPQTVYVQPAPPPQYVQAPAVQPACSPGTEPVYSRTYTRDQQGRLFETTTFVGCTPTKP